MKKFKEFFAKRKVKKKTAYSNNQYRNNVNYINQPPYGAEGRTLTPTSN